MIGVRYEVEGLPELMNQFSALGERIQRRVFMNALKKNAAPLVEKMKELCPVSEHGVNGERLESRNHPAGYLKASIGIVVGTGSQYPTVWVRPRFKSVWDPWYEHFPMGGTKVMEKAPVPFVDMAWDEMGAMVQRSLEENLINDIQAEINKL
jgi:hypothetical protein